MRSSPPQPATAGWDPVDVLAAAPVAGPPDEVHVWRLPLDVPQTTAARLEAVLDTRERARAGRLRSPDDRHRFVVAHGLVRHVLACYAGVAADRVAYRFTRRGKPHLVAPRTGWSVPRFNLTHSGRYALCAVAWDREVGVDVEEVRSGRDHVGMAERYFSASEVAALRALPAAQQREAFYTCWTRKEAYLKARGDGLSVALESFDVSVGAGVPAALLRSEAGADEAARWAMQHLWPAPGYVAAVAVERHGWTLRTFSYEAEEGH